MTLLLLPRTLRYVDEVAGDVMLLLLAEHESLAPAKLRGTHDDLSRDTTNDGGVIDIEIDKIAEEDDAPGQLVLVSEFRNISESLRDQVTFGVG